VGRSLRHARHSADAPHHQGRPPTGVEGRAHPGQVGDGALPKYATLRESSMLKDFLRHCKKLLERCISQSDHVAELWSENIPTAGLLFSLLGSFLVPTADADEF
jgi:hypothetical protein